MDFNSDIQLVFSMNYPTTQPSLLMKLQQGDEISWADFYHRYAPVISCAGKYYHLDDSECEDLTQQVMLKFFANSKSFTYRAGQVKFRSYFSRIVHNQIVDTIRRNNSRQRLQQSSSVLYEDFHEVFMNEWRKAAFAEAEAELKRRVDEKTFQAFELYGLQNRPAAQVAEILDISMSSLYTAKSRCMKLLQEIIERYNRTDGELKLEL
ncbi:MAG: sigma-70 family RNA polymerase sigma factor [Lentisphaerae bacterium]|nr:sigma-70 family RNA polymerase sigma factor [Lentisphaerota bacterium]